MPNVSRAEPRYSAPALSSAELFAANAANRLFLSRAMCRGPRALDVEHAHCEILLSGVAHPVCNGVFRASLPQATLDESLGQIFDLFRELGLPALFWVEADARPSGLAEALAARGAERAGQMKDIAVDLAGFPVPPLPAVGMSAVRTEAERASWSELFAASFGLPEPVREHVRQVLASRASPNVEHYLVSIGEQAVATLTLSFTHGVAGVYNVTVKEGHRGKDLAQAMLGKAIARITERGYRYAVGSAVEELLPFYGKAPLTVLGTTDLYAIA